MLLILPVAAFVMFFLILRERALEWRRAILTASVFWGTCVVAITEILSVPRLITRGATAGFWLAICVAGFLYLRVLKSRASRPLQSPNPPGEPPDRVIPILLGALGFVVFLVGITAVIAPPDVWDAMEYHLPRMIMWMSNRSVRFFPTPDYRQLIFGPWAEYAMMHAELLWGSDRFVNLVEFFSLIGSSIAVSVIAEKLGAGARGQVFAAVICGTIPEGLLEASGPMNTYVVAFWVAATVVFLIEWNDDPSWLNTVCIGLAAGLALLTKATAYVFLPFLVLACWWMGSSSARVVFLKRSTVFLLLILALNFPQYVRSYEFGGSPLGMPLPVPYPPAQAVVEHVTFRGTLANVLRNVSLHLCTPSAGVNSRIERLLRLTIRKMGVNPDDPGESWLGLPFHMNHFTSNEIIEGNLLHLGLFLFSLILIFGRRNDSIQYYKWLWYALGIVLSFVLYCALLRWGMWSSRYHLVLFVVASAFSGVALERYCSRRLGTAVAAVLLLSAVFFALTNRSRSLIPWSRVDDIYHPRSVLYFSNEHESFAPTQIAAAGFVNQLDCRNVGIDSYAPDPTVGVSPDSFFVDPLLELIHADGRSRTVWYTGVNDLSSRYQEQEAHPAPCAVICLACANIPEKWQEYRSVGGRASVFKDIVVFSAEGPISNSGASRTAAN